MMDETLKKKINLLVYLANSDGKFHVSEKAFLRDILQQRGATDFDFDKVIVEANLFKDVASIVDKQELMYWCLQLIKADGIVHPDEIAYCKALGIKLKFSPKVIDKYILEELPTFEVFSKELRGFVL